MVRVLFVNVGGTVIAEGGEKKEEIARESALEAEDKEDEDEYIKEQGNGEDAAFEDTRMLVDVEDIKVGFGSQSAEEG